jgi:hypothetical protein
VRVDVVAQRDDLPCYAIEEPGGGFRSVPLLRPLPAVAARIKTQIVFYNLNSLFDIYLFNNL